MKNVWIWIVLLAVASFACGCRSHSSGSREFVPGQGWKHTD